MGPAAKSLERKRVVLGSLLFLALFVLFWQLSVKPSVGGRTEGLPGPLAVLQTAREMLAHPFYDRGPNDKGIGIQLFYSLGRLALGYSLASLAAVFLGVVLGLHPTLYRSLNPFIQILKPISPLAWMPLFLYTIKDSGRAAVMVIFMSSLWPTLANTAFGVAGIKRDYLNVSSILQLSWLARLFKVILPAAAPAIVAGLRISMGSAWIAIVAAEMLIGGTGVGYFVWNEWNNLQLTSVIFAILMIGAVGVLLDIGLGRLARRLSYTE
ncbi:MAG TPA: nitrate ABC transporter permease [Candidatus Binatia bacterium]